MSETQIKIELVHSGYLTGWEILHYKKLLEKLKLKKKK